MLYTRRQVGGRVRTIGNEGVKSPARECRSLRRTWPPQREILFNLCLKAAKTNRNRIVSSSNVNSRIPALVMHMLCNSTGNPFDDGLNMLHKG